MTPNKKHLAFCWLHGEYSCATSNSACPTCRKKGKLLTAEQMIATMERIEQ